VELPATLPRRLHTAVLRLLRPAEAAVRRLVIVAARGLVVTLPPPRPPKPVPVATALRSLGIAVTLSPAELAGAAPKARPAAAARAARPRGLSLPLLDPLRGYFRQRRVYVPAHAAPRIWVSGVTEPHRLPPPPSPNDPVDAARLGRRFAALVSVLDDLPAQARRIARWRARRDAIIAQDRNRAAASVQTGTSQNHLPHRRPHSLWPLRPGHPPSWRRKPDHEVHEVLNVVHGLAFWALESPDTS
jgi:hypothetical protein